MELQLGRKSRASFRRKSESFKSSSSGGVGNDDGVRRSSSYRAGGQGSNRLELENHHKDHHQPSPRSKRQKSSSFSKTVQKNSHSNSLNINRSNSNPVNSKILISLSKPHHSSETEDHVVPDLDNVGQEDDLRNQSRNFTFLVEKKKNMTKSSREDVGTETETID